MWEHFSHQSDIGIRAVGESLSRAFEDAGMGLTAIVTNPENVETTEPVTIKLSAENQERLFHNWMDEIIYEMDTRKMLFGRFEVKIDPAPSDSSTLNTQSGEIDNLKLSAIIWGEKINYEKHDLAVEPKGVTLNQLSVKEENNKWIVQCVIDV